MSLIVEIHLHDYDDSFQRERRTLAKQFSIHEFNDSSLGVGGLFELILADMDRKLRGAK